MELTLYIQPLPQPYAALKAREYLDKPAIHETMVKVRTFSFNTGNLYGGGGGVQMLWTLMGLCLHIVHARFVAGW